MRQTWKRWSIKCTTKILKATAVVMKPVEALVVSNSGLPSVNRRGRNVGIILYRSSTFQDRAVPPTSQQLGDPGSLLKGGEEMDYRSLLLKNVRAHICSPSFQKFHQRYCLVHHAR